MSQRPHYQRRGIIRIQLKNGPVTLNPNSGQAGLAKNRQNLSQISGGFAHAQAPLPRTDRRGSAAG